MKHWTIYIFNVSQFSLSLTQICIDLHIIYQFVFSG